MGVITNSFLLDCVTCLATVIAICIAYLKWRWTYWQNQGVPTLPTTIPFGNSAAIFLRQRSLTENSKYFYDAFKAMGAFHGGLYSGANLSYMPISLDLIKTIIQKDFAHFMSHGIYYNEKNEPLTGHLFNLDGPKWRSMRVKLTPTFTSGKMKMMYQAFIDCTSGLKNAIAEYADQKTPVDIKEILACFTTDIIGSCAFGIECNSFTDPDAEFRKYGRRVFQNSALDVIKLISRSLMPVKLVEFLKLRTMKPDVEKFFLKAVKDTVEYREKNDIYRKDFMHLLIQLKNRGKVTDDAQLVGDESNVEDRITINELAAQAFVFFLAGFETSSTTMTFALLEIAYNQEIQQKLRNEIDEVLKKHEGKLTYDAIMEMTYLHKILEESLRKYPPVPSLPRKCTKDYQVPNTNAIIPKGTRVVIPVYAIHHDPDYYPNPEVFDPERFSDENKAKRHPCAWLPFGEGPRICIANQIVTS